MKAMKRWVLKMVMAVLAGVVVALPATLALPAAGGVRVVVSIKPLHGLVAAVMAGTGEPHLIVEGGNSPHTYALKPSDAAALQDAEVVFWMGEGMERFLAKSLEALAGGARIVALAQAPGLVRYTVRQGGAWEPDDDEGEEAGGPDMHMWLDPVNAAAMAETIAAALGEADAANAGLYAANGQRLKDRLAALTAAMAAALAPVKGRPFIVFHDGFQYLEKRFHLNAAGSITINPEVAPGARRVADIRAHMLDLGVDCIFAEPQFEPAIIAAVAQGTGARSAVLDPLGADLPKGPDLYIDLMRRNVKALVECLGG